MAAKSVFTHLFGASLFDTADGVRGWLYRALSLLIVACPCSLVISTPVTVVSAMTALARRGVLVKGGAYLDALSRVRVFALDKTGTLTQGQPKVVEARALDCLPSDKGRVEATIRCAACDEMLALASSVERRSEHPLAQAILSEAMDRDVHHRYPAAEAVQALAGRGIEGTLSDTTITVGSHALFHEREVDCVLHDDIVGAEANGSTVMLVGRDDKVLGFVGTTDVLRESSRDAMRALKRLDPMARVVMLTGDAVPVAYAISRTHFFGKDVIDSLLDLPIVISPVALGAALLVFFNTPLGSAIDDNVIKFVFSVPGIVLAQITVISALAVRLLKSTFDSIDPRFEQVSRTLGCSKPEAFFRVTLPLARDRLIASSILTWARAVGEFGATVTLAGATAMKTETLPTAIYLSLASADVEKAIAVIFVLVIIAVAALLIIRKVIGRRYQI